MTGTSLRLSGGLVLRGLLRVPVALTYAMLLSAATATFRALPPEAQDRVIGYVSTNLHNLAHGHIDTLLTSAFIADDDLFYVWLPGLICLLAAAELPWSSPRLVAVFFGGHVVTTLIVAAGLVVAVERDWLPRYISQVEDVGVSYGVLTVVGALTAVVPARCKPAWLGWWSAGAGAVLAVSTDFTAFGHAVAFGLGLLMSTRLNLPVRWTRANAMLCVIGVCFGYAVLVQIAELAAVGVPASAVGAALVAMISGWLSRVKNVAEGLPQVCQKKH